METSQAFRFSRSLKISLINDTNRNSCASVGKAWGILKPPALSFRELSTIIALGLLAQALLRASIQVIPSEYMMHIHQLDAAIQFQKVEIQGYDHFEVLQ